MADWEIIPIIVAMAFAPGFFWLWYFYKRDTFEPEPLRLVRSCFLLGMASTIPALFLENPLPISKFYLSVAAAPVIEEVCKFLVVYLTVYRSAEFDEPIDGLVYAAAAALGFASIENFIYLYDEYQKASGAVTIVMVMRAFLSVPGHACFSGMWGYALGMAKFTREKVALKILSGLLLAIALHAVFNFLLSLGQLSILGMIILVPVMWQLVDDRVALALQRSPHAPKRLTDKLKDVKSALINRHESWYENRFVVALSLFVLCFPLGLYGLWKTSQFSRPVKAVYLALWLVGLGLAGTYAPNHSLELIDAARSGNTALMQDLLKKGADVNGKTATGETPLIAASTRGHWGAVTLLLERGADINAGDNQERTPLLHASAAGHSAVAQLLIQKRANVDSQDMTGTTALIVAADKGHAETARMLLLGKANVFLSKKSGVNALMIASLRGHVHIVQLVLENQAEVNARDSKGQTALILAAMHGRSGAVRLLLEHGADVSLKDESGRTALSHASQRRHSQVVKLLQKQPAPTPPWGSRAGKSNGRTSFEAFALRTAKNCVFR
jgi:protease PrsW